MIPITNLSGRLGNQMFQLAYLYAQVWDGNLSDIYLQNPFYFDRYRSELMTLYGQGVEPIDQVAIHVRRAGNPANPNEPNYSENPFYVNLMDTTYYEDAMALFPGESFLIFSDDIKWCKKQKIFKRCSFSKGDEITDFNRMAGCKGVIIANSSFSWWAGYLSRGKVVAPKDWYADGKERTVCPPEWVRI